MVLKNCVDLLSLNSTCWVDGSRKGISGRLFDSIKRGVEENFLQF